VDGLPFEGAPRVSIVLPESQPTLGGLLGLLELERPGFEAELGAPVEFVTGDPGAGPRWSLVLDAAYEGPPATAWDARGGAITSRARDVDGLLEALNLWRTVRRRGGGSVEATDCPDRDEVIRRVVDEIADTYPAFELRGLSWEAICARRIDDARGAHDFLAALQQWVAELEDAHTWVWPGHGNLPYVLRVEGATAQFAHVPGETAGYAAGVRAGWRLATVDEAEPDAERWRLRTAAPPHSRPYLAGRRLLAGPPGVPRALTAVGPSGREASWEEAPTGRLEGEPVRWRRLASGAAYLRIESWIEGRGTDDAIDAAFAELRGCEKLILDLRRNPGGNLLLAGRTRDRFLRRETQLGTIRYSTGLGGLSTPFTLRAEPASAAKRWPGRLVVLTDELTFSSSEDFLLGLQGLEHVTVVGRPSGGGSGRPRSIRLLRGWMLTVSTALTYDRAGRCIEGAGVPVDVPVAAGGDGRGDAVLAAAESL
jgi:carboxyl-terminal processing protease